MSGRDVPGRAVDVVLGGARGSIVLGNHGVVVVVGWGWCKVVVVLGVAVGG
jgi:hypothetical protein